MDIINQLIGIMSGAVGGVLAGDGLKDQGLGVVGNLLVGIAGGWFTAVVLRSFGAAAGSGTDALDPLSFMAIVAGCGVGGALLAVFSGLIKGMIMKAWRV